MGITGIQINGISITQEHGHLLLSKDGIQMRCDFWELNDCISEFEEYLRENKLQTAFVKGRKGENIMCKKIEQLDFYDCIVAELGKVDFQESGYSLESVINDYKLMERISRNIYRAVNRYDCELYWAIDDAIEEELEVQMPGHIS